MVMLTALLSYLYVYDMKGATHDCSSAAGGRYRDDQERIYAARETSSTSESSGDGVTNHIYIVPLPMWEGW